MIPVTQAELLINIRSRQSKDKQALILDALERNGLEVTHTSELGRHSNLEDILAGIKSRQPKLLIVGGGDGTVTEVVDHLVGTDIEIGILPLGTTNNFARSLGIPLDIESAIENIKHSSANLVDAGEVSGDYFMNVAGIGLSAEVASTITNKMKQRLGRLAYAIVGLRCFVSHKAFMVTIRDSDNELKLNFETHQLIIANGRFHAGKQIAQDARVDNRELIIFGLGGRSKINFIWHMLDFYIGRRKKVEHSSYLIGKNVQVSTNTPQPVELDGEVKFTTPVTAQVRPGALRVRYKP